MRRLVAIAVAVFATACGRHSGVAVPIPVEEGSSILWRTDRASGFDEDLSSVLLPGGARGVDLWEYQRSDIAGGDWDREELELLTQRRAESCRCTEMPLGETLIPIGGEQCDLPPLKEGRRLEFNGETWVETSMLPPGGLVVSARRSLVEQDEEQVRPEETCTPYLSDEQLSSASSQAMRFSAFAPENSYQDVVQSSGIFFAAGGPAHGVVRWSDTVAPKRREWGPINNQIDPITPPDEFTLGWSGGQKPSFRLITSESQAGVSCGIEVCELVPSFQSPHPHPGAPLVSVGDASIETGSVARGWLYPRRLTSASGWEEVPLDRDNRRDGARDAAPWRAAAFGPPPRHVGWLIDDAFWFLRTGVELGILSARSRAVAEVPDAKPKALWVEQSDRVVTALQTETGEVHLWELVQVPDQEPGCSVGEYCFRPVPTFDPFSCGGAEVVGMAGPLEQLVAFFADGQARSVRGSGCEATGLDTIAKVAGARDGRIMLLTEDGKLHHSRP